MGGLLTRGASGAAASPIAGIVTSSAIASAIGGVLDARAYIRRRRSQGWAAIVARIRAEDSYPRPRLTVPGPRASSTVPTDLVWPRPDRQAQHWNIPGPVRADGPLEANLAALRPVIIFPLEAQRAGT